jgi:hypothetical protein
VSLKKQNDIMVNCVIWWSPQISSRRNLEGIIRVSLGKVVYREGQGKTTKYLSEDSWSVPCLLIKKRKECLSCASVTVLF